MANQFFQNFLEAAIVIGVIGGIGVIYYAKMTKKNISTVLKKISSIRLFKTNEEDLYETNKNKIQEGVHQVWPERRTIM